MKINSRVRVSLLVFLFCGLTAAAQDIAAVNVTGGGTADFIPRWTGPHNLGNSLIFQTVGGQVGIGTTTPGTKLDVNGAFKIHGTSFSIDPSGKIHFVAGQTFPGVGDITAVNAGSGVLGGGTHGNVTLSLDTGLTDSRYAQLAASNTFGPDQAFQGSIFFSVLACCGQVAGTDIFGSDVQLSSGDARVVVANNNSSTQTVQMQNFVNGFGFIEAQFDLNGTATFFTDNAGNTTARGTKSAAVPLHDGSMVKVFSMESPEVWFEDFGSGQLMGGITMITLEPTFAQTVNLKSGYHVFLTPKGDCKGLYVTGETETGFEVREMGGGQSSVDFDYRIVAHRAQYEKMRLPATRLPKVGQPKQRPAALIQHTGGSPLR
jgi:hypothetical protein